MIQILASEVESKKNKKKQKGWVIRFGVGHIRIMAKSSFLSIWGQYQ